MMCKPWPWVYARELPRDFAAAGAAGGEEEVAAIAAAALREAAESRQRRQNTAENTGDNAGLERKTEEAAGGVEAFGDGSKDEL
jgi:hypothetical protein